MFKCGSCHFGKIIDQDLTKRMCHGAPPNAIQARAPMPGQMTLQMARPIVSVTDDACALYRNKNAVDHAADASAMDMVKRVSEGKSIEEGTGTKQ
jgi:hypothetical protein